MNTQKCITQFHWSRKDAGETAKGTKDQLLLDKMVLNDCKKRHTNLGIAWIEYKKAYDCPFLDFENS